MVGLDPQKFFVSQGRIVDMGRLITTGFSTDGHRFEFVESNSDMQQICLMVCDCGWNIPIESFQHSWSIIEIKVRVKEHLAKFGITTDHPAAIFELDGGAD